MLYLYKYMCLQEFKGNHIKCHNLITSILNIQ